METKLTSPLLSSGVSEHVSCGREWTEILECVTWEKTRVIAKESSTREERSNFSLRWKALKCSKGGECISPRARGDSQSWLVEEERGAPAEPYERTSDFWEGMAGEILTWGILGRRTLSFFFLTVEFCPHCHTQPHMHSHLRKPDTHTHIHTSFP